MQNGRSCESYRIRIQQALYHVACSSFYSRWKTFAGHQSADYLGKLDDYLKNGFDGGPGIILTSEADHYQVDLSEAVPTGLTISEGVSNAYEFAFQDNRSDFGFAENTDDNVVLEVGDDGIDLPDNLRH